jgi:hypothetical protein
VTSNTWTRPHQVLEALHRKWAGGQYLASAAQGQLFEPFSVPLKGPAAADVLHHYEQVLDWAKSWAPGQHPRLRIQTKIVGGRSGIPANPVPERVWVDTREQLWFLLGVAAEVELFHVLQEQTLQRDPDLAQWMQHQPMKVLRNADQWHRLVATTLWIRDHATAELYLRQIDVPGVDTKFIENNKGILGELLDHSLPDDRIHPDVSRSDFASRYGFLAKPVYIRLRYLGTPPGPFSELTVRAAELASKPAGIRTVFVLENEVTYLSLPPIPDAIAILGSGYAATLLRHLPWLADVDLHYWGDIDTHGFAILSQVRARFPQTRSLLMDSRALLAHQDHWGEEKSQTLASPKHLTEEEARLEWDLRQGTYQIHLRLEQERIPVSTVIQALDALSIDQGAGLSE